MNDAEFHAILADLVRRHGEQTADLFVTEVVRRTRVTNAQDRVGAAVAGALALRGSGKVTAQNVFAVVAQGALGMAEALQAGALPVVEPPTPVRVVRTETTRKGTSARTVEVEVIDAEFEEVP